jgi:hypothetical protein
MKHFMPVWLHNSPSKCVTLSFQASRSHGPFDQGEIGAVSTMNVSLPKSFRTSSMSRQSGAMEQLVSTSASSSAEIRIDYASVSFC